MTLWGIHIPPLITMTSAVSLPPFGLELILSVGGTVSDVLSQTDHNCFFIIEACCSTAKHGKYEKAEEETILPFTSPTHRQRHTHIFFLLCPQLPWSCIWQAPQWLSQLAVNIRTTLSPKTFRCTPPNPSVQTSGAGQPHNVSTQPGNCWTRTLSCLAGWLIAVSRSLAHTQTSFLPFLLVDLTANMHGTVLCTQRG